MPGTPRRRTSQGIHPPVPGHVQLDQGDAQVPEAVRQLLCRSAGLPGGSPSGALARAAPRTSGFLPPAETSTAAARRSRNGAVNPNGVSAREGWPVSCLWTCAANSATASAPPDPTNTAGPSWIARTATATETLRRLDDAYTDAKPATSVRNRDPVSSDLGAGTASILLPEQMFVER